MRLFLALLLLPCALLAQSDDFTEPNGITHLAYATDRAVVTETTALPEFDGHTVELVEGRVLGTTDAYGSLRFTKEPTGTLFNNGYAPASGSIPTNQLAAVATQLQLVIDEVLGRTPERSTAFSYGSSEGFGVSGAYREGGWRISLSLGGYGQDNGTPLTPAQFEELVTLLRAAASQSAP